MVNEQNHPKKVLVIQLARLGDIYQMRPTLRAMRRSWPGCEIHLLTRQRFAAAAPGQDVIDRHWKLDTREILEPLVDERPAIAAAIGKIETLIQGLRAEGFDRIINLSFSPLSSHLTHALKDNESSVRGYARFDDGFLQIPDDASAYFYAQVGSGRENRLHLTDLFAHVADVTLEEQDWGLEPVDADAARSPEVIEAAEGSIVIHVGASDLEKTLHWSKWLQVVKGLLENQTEKVVLVGSPDEREIAESVAAVSCERKPLNLVGRTSLTQLFEIIRKARLVIGGDSAPVQIASLTGTKVLNLSLPIVRFWETGPRSAGSRILLMDDQEALTSDQIVAEARAILSGQPPLLSVIRVPGPTIPYLETRPQPGSFEWKLIEALYMGGRFPEPIDERFLIGVQRLIDVNQIALDQIELLMKQPSNQTAALILNRADEIIDQIVRMVPEVGPIVRWFQVERIRIGPMAALEVATRTLEIHRRLSEVLGVYGSEQISSHVQREGDHDDIGLG